MRAVYALYSDGESAQQAVNGLRAAGVNDNDIEILSDQPMEHFEFGQRDSRTLMWWIACGGGLVGMAIGTSLTFGGQRAWPIVTGGMPISPWWTNLIIIFELTMLVAILSSVVTLLVSGGLLTKHKKRLYDPEVTRGKILVGVEDPDDKAVERLKAVLGTPRGALVKTV